MTVTLSYTDATAKVSITATELYVSSAAKIERSTNQSVWTTVRGGSALSITPRPGLVLPGTASNYASTPDNAALDIVADIDIRAEVTLTNWNTGAQQALIAKWNTTTDQRSYQMFISSTGALGIAWSTAGTAGTVLTATSTVNPTTVAGSGRLALRATLDVNDGGGNRVVQFFTSTSILGPWTQLGTTVTTAGVTSIFSGSAVLEVGSVTNGTLLLTAGTVHAVELRNTIGTGGVVANPFWGYATPAAGSFTDGTGRVWTMNGTAATVHGTATLNDYEFTPNVVNYYRVTSVPAGLYQPGSLGDYASTPDNAALDITGDIDIRADLTMSSWTPVTTGALIAKWTDSGNQLSYFFGVDSAGKIMFFWTTGGTGGTGVFSASSVSTGFTNNSRHCIRATLDVNNGVGGYTVAYYTGPTMTGPWTQLGALVIGGAPTSIFSGTSNVEIGAHNSGTADILGGFILHSGSIRNGINGVEVANPDFEAQNHLTTSFADAAGRTWTLNAQTRILTSQTANITPNLTQIWLKSVTRPFLNQPVSTACSRPGVNPLELLESGSAITRRTRANTFPIVNRTYPIASNDIGLSRVWTTRYRTWTADALQTLDFLMASGDVILIQVPGTACADTIEHGYVVVHDPSYTRHHRYRNRVVWDIPVEEVAPPGPDVAYAEVTWQTVLNMFATWADLLAACPTWADVLALLPDPSEVIVP